MKKVSIEAAERYASGEMALFSECTFYCARKLLDTADIIREAMFRQPSD
jgi:hypothetical protein